MTDHASSELEPPAVLLKRGSKGQKVRQVQEWLCLHGFHTAVDGVFGPATEAALKAFQRSADYGTGLRSFEAWGAIYVHPLPKRRFEEES